MADLKFLFIYRMPPSSDPQNPPSPAEMQAMMAQWEAWKAKFSAYVADLGDGLKPGGRQLANGVITDGAFIEAKEVVAGYSLVTARNYEDALTVAQECPITRMPGHRIEIRELAGY